MSAKYPTIVGDVTLLNALSDSFSASDSCSFVGKFVAVLPKAFHSPKFTVEILFLIAVKLVNSSCAIVSAALASLIVCWAVAFASWEAVVSANTASASFIAFWAVASFISIGASCLVASFTLAIIWS